MTQQQRQAAWEAVHRPETSSDDLARIAQAHPEFAQAIAAHPNTAAQAPAAQYAAAHLHAPGQNLAPAGPAATAQNGRLNVFGIIALSILALHSIMNAFTPIIVSRTALDLGLSSMNISMLFAGITLAWTLVAGGFALAGALQKQAPRMRWTAISSLVVCALALLSLIASLFSGLLAPLFY